FGSSYRHGHPRHDPSLPTRRSSDLVTDNPFLAFNRTFGGFRASFDRFQPIGGQVGSLNPTGTVTRAQLERWLPRWMRTPEHRRRSEEHTSELQSRENLVCRLLLEKK